VNREALGSGARAPHVPFESRAGIGQAGANTLISDGSAGDSDDDGDTDTDSDSDSDRRR